MTTRLGVTRPHRILLLAHLRSLTVPEPSPCRLSPGTMLPGRGLVGEGLQVELQLDVFVEAVGHTGRNRDPFLVDAASRLAGDFQAAFDFTHAVGVFFDADRICVADVMTWLHSLALPSWLRQSELGRSFTIPVCYEMQLDMPRVCEATHLTADEVIRLHTATTYTVYAIGFVPGFPYLGYLPPELCGVSRLPSPRVRVEPGSVGLTGRQTGIYPLARPGGWNLIGRTPLTIVDVASGFFPLRDVSSGSAAIDRAEADRRLFQADIQRAEERVAVASARLAERLNLDPTAQLSPIAGPRPRRVCS